MTSPEQGNIIDYIRSQDFRKTLLAIVIFMGIVLLAIFLWLRIYTHHGQELMMPDYTGIQYEDAVLDAANKKFRISIQDSLHILGKPGGMILKQHPTPGSLVKSRRMIYVTITKRSPDKILSARLPELYGKSYERKKQELEDHFKIKSRIVDTKFDPGDPGQILEVRYKGQTILGAKGRDNNIQIEKGDYLEFVISAKSGGEVEIPDLTCKTYEEALFLLENLGLRIGTVQEEEDVEDLSLSFIFAQEPMATGAMIKMDSPIHVSVRRSKPADCF